MKLLSKRISPILKLVLLFSLLIGGSHAKVVSSDRFILRVVDRIISVQDLKYQSRNLKVLSCAYEDSFVIQYFGSRTIKDLQSFVQHLPETNESVRNYLHQQEKSLSSIRKLFKLLRYSEDQKTTVSQNVIKLIRESIQSNHCNLKILHKDSLKTNFIGLLEVELYLRARYGSQLKAGQKFDLIKPSIDLFIESLDKQFYHEYFW